MYVTVTQTVCMCERKKGERKKGEEIFLPNLAFQMMKRVLGGGDSPVTAEGLVQPAHPH